MRNRRHWSGKQRGGQRGRQMLPGLLLLLACASSSAQVYKWTDAQGTVHYSDTPPPQQRATQMDTPTQGAGSESASALPYELARAVKASPVTLYTTRQSDCTGCDKGRALLRARGVPYLEKTVDTDQDMEALRRLSGKLELPLLVVGSRMIAGFEDAAWQAALTTAAYPRSAQLPSGYQYAAPAPAAAPATMPAPPARAKNAPAPDEAAAQAAEQQPRRPAPNKGNAPPGFQF